VVSCPVLLAFPSAPAYAGACFRSLQHRPGPAKPSGGSEDGSAWEQQQQFPRPPPDPAPAPLGHKKLHTDNLPVSSIQIKTYYMKY
jgi:hypothetical protein